MIKKTKIPLLVRRGKQYWSHQEDANEIQKNNKIENYLGPTAL